MKNIYIKILKFQREKRNKMKFFFPLIFILIIFFTIGCQPMNDEEYNSISPLQRQMMEEKWEEKRQYNLTKRAYKDALREHEREKKR